MDMKRAIPSNNWYTPPLYFPIKNLPLDLQYYDVKCSIIESFVKYKIQDWRYNDFLSAEEEEKAIESFNNCKFTICSNNAFVEKLSNDYMAMTELATAMMSVSKKFWPLYDVFKFVVDPIFWDIVLNVPYPVVEQEYYLDQNNAAYEIITKVCGSQNLTLKSKLIPETVNRLFLDILVDAYVPSSFHDSDKDSIAAEIDPDKLKELWNLGAERRDTGGICFDSALTDMTERTSISRVRETAKELGIDCGGEEDEGSDFEYGDFASAPASPGSSSGGAAPTSRGSSARWASGPPSSRGGSSGFAPGT
uniref:uncharacterized protein LOC120331684 n=1 Tax=Styela clava TaxID=7725 RepID=UPI00193957EE|nr:uncharacterized protein LOC120331684 [Styela clava]